ncbi:MAG: zinc ribbon domain-containing protein [Anaerolineae bacterium]
MKKLGATVIALLSIPFITLGLVFLVAANSSSRLLTALALIAIGVILLAAGVRRLRRLAAISEEALMAGAVEMASRMGGELTVAQLQAEYAIPQALAQKVMDRLSEAGTAAPQPREDRVVYVFTGLLPAMARKLCPYCGTELPVREALRKCPNCGAQLEITKT